YLRAGRQHGRLGGHGPAANCATASSNCDSSARRTRTFVRSRSPSASETSAGIASMTAPESTTPTPSKARGTPADCASWSTASTEFTSLTGTRTSRIGSGYTGRIRLFGHGLTANLNELVARLNDLDRVQAYT